MGTLRNVELKKPNLESLTRVRYPLAVGSTIKEGEWFTIDATGKAVLTGATPNGMMFLNFEDSTNPSVSDVQNDNFGGVTGSIIGTGGVVGLEGMYRFAVKASVGVTGTPAQFTELTAKTGKLIAAASGEVVVGFVELPVDPTGRLHVRAVSPYRKP